MGEEEEQERELEPLAPRVALQLPQREQLAHRPLLRRNGRAIPLLFAALAPALIIILLLLG